MGHPGDFFGSASFFELFGSLFLVLSLFLIASSVLIMVSMWKVYEKAGLAGWKSIVPFYNVYCLTLVAGIEWWYFILLFIPYVGIPVAVYMIYKTAKKFGFDWPFAVGLFFLPFVFYPILAFGDAQYNFEEGLVEEAVPAVNESAETVVESAEVSASVVAEATQETASEVSTSVDDTGKSS